MDLQQWVEYCLTLPGVYLGHPFGGESPVVRHNANRKIFALFLYSDKQPLLNLKCEPMQAEFWRQVYPWVIPGWHMNKTHWNSVLLSGHPPGDEVRAMIAHSHALTAPRRR